MTSFTVLCVVISVLVTLALREVVTWYWKVNRVVKSLESIEELLLLGLDLDRSISIQHKNKNEKLRTISVGKYLEMSRSVRDNYTIVKK